MRVLAKRPPRSGAGSIGEADLVLGDVTDRLCTDRAVGKASRVIHLAAIVRSTPQEAEAMRVNVGGTENVLRSCLQAGVRSLVHVSSGAAVSFGAGGTKDERSIVPRAGRLPPYARSKLLAERAVESAAREGLHASIVYPTRVFGIGPLDESNMPTVVLRAYLRGRFRLLPGGGRDWANWAYVRDVAAGIVDAALRAGRCERYILGGENATLKRFFDLAGSIAGRRRTMVNVPHTFGRALASLEELRAAAAHGSPRLTRAWYDTVFEDARQSSAKAERELAYSVTPLNQALEEIIPWLRSL